MDSKSPWWIPEVLYPKRMLDFAVQLAFALTRMLTDWTLARLYLALFIFLPLYIFVKTLEALPAIIANTPRLLSLSGRSDLVREADEYRRREEDVAKFQLDGSFLFSEHQLEKPWVSEITREAKWWPNVDVMEVCGATVRVVHEMPKNQVEGKSPILLLHGNPSWSYMWRDIIPIFAFAGHEVFALDFLGHGLSDKPTDPSTMHIELHIRSILALFQTYNIAARNPLILAHDWGGCIFSIAAPELPVMTSPRLIYLNSFLPPRPSDISLNCFALYVLWFLSTGILGGWMPEWFVMRYMCPTVLPSAILGYSAPYRHASAAAKVGVGRLSHAVPGFPDEVLLDWRRCVLWRTIEGLLGPSKFTNFNEQGRLVEMNSSIRAFWSRASREGWKVGVLFGKEDPLLRDFKKVLEKTIDGEAFLGMQEDGWVEGAGHYPVEERAETVVRLVLEWLDRIDCSEKRESIVDQESWKETHSVPEEEKFESDGEDKELDCAVEKHSQNVWGKRFLETLEEEEEDDDDDDRKTKQAEYVRKPFKKDKGEVWW